MLTERGLPIRNYRHGYLIYNPNAGRLRGKGRRRLDAALRILKDAGHEIEPIPTTGPRTASALAADCVRQGADLILAAGGDGTVNEIANGMIHSGVPLGLLPAGTANVLAVETGVPRSLERAAAGISTAVAEPISAGILKNEANPEGRYFLLMAGAGLDAHIVHHLDPHWKAVLGKLSYWIGGFAQLARRLPEFEVESGPVSGRFSFALLSRVRNYGGDIEIARDVNLLDDRFEAVLFRGPNPFVYLRYFLAILAGRQARARGIAICHTTQARIEAPTLAKAYVQVDGEAAGELPATIEVVPAAITLLLPPAYLARARSQTAVSWTTSPTR